MRLKARAAISAVARARGSGLVSRTSGRRVMRASPLAATRNLATPSGVRGRSSSGTPGVPLRTAAAHPVAAAATAPVAATAPAAARAGRIRQLDLQRPAIHFLPIELLHGLSSFLGRRHLDEAEPARAAGITVRHNRGRLDGARGGEQLAQAIVGRGERQPTDEELLSHDQPPNSSPAADDALWTAEVRTRVRSGEEGSAMNR